MSTRRLGLKVAGGGRAAAPVSYECTQRDRVIVIDGVKKPEPINPTQSDRFNNPSTNQ